MDIDESSMMNGSGISSSSTPPNDSEAFEIIIPSRSSTAAEAAKKLTSKKARSIKKKDRLLRIEMHKVHLLCLLSSGMIRNQWCNDPDLQVIGIATVSHSDRCVVS
jgi:xeroderma pigmentosum group C-complementing protein